MLHIKQVGNKGSLIQPLGAWVASHHQRWSWFRSKFSNLVYQVLPDLSWRVYKPIRQSRRITRASASCYKKAQYVPTSKPATILLPATPKLSHSQDYDIFTITFSTEPIPSPTYPSPRSCFLPNGDPHPYFCMMAPLSKILEIPNLECLLQAIQSYQLMVICEGCYDPTPKTRIPSMGVCVRHRHPLGRLRHRLREGKDMNFTRAMLSSLTSALFLIRWLCANGSVSFLSRSKSTVKSYKCIK